MMLQIVLSLTYDLIGDSIGNSWSIIDSSGSNIDKSRIVINVCEQWSKLCCYSLMNSVATLGL